MKEKKTMTRKISFLEFFNQLQKEYLVAEIRYKIYTNIVDKKYYKEREMLGKKNTIENISIKNNLPSIFSNKELYNNIRHEIIGEWGLPKFLYRDELDKEKRGIRDIYNYFSRRSEVSVLLSDGKIKQGKVVKIMDIIEKTVLVNIDETNSVINFNNIRREDL